MVTEEEAVDPIELPSKAGDDTTPIMALVRDQPYARGGITSESRTSSQAYVDFVNRARNQAHATRR